MKLPISVVKAFVGVWPEEIEGRNKGLMMILRRIGFKAVLAKSITQLREFASRGGGNGFFIELSKKQKRGTGVVYYTPAILIQVQEK